MSEIPPPPPEKPVLLVATAAVCDVVAELQRIDAKGITEAEAVVAITKAVVATGIERRRHLVRAAALLIDEIERYDRDNDEGER